jgi:alginate O-acetyltransferase complex protein AlgI
MAICGLWHGAAWTFVVWGVWHGLMLVAGEVVGRWTPTRGFVRGRLGAVLGWAVTLCGVFAGWAFFRAKNLADALSMLTSVASFEGGLRPSLLRENAVLFVALIAAGTAVVHLLKASEWEPTRPLAALRRVSPLVLPVLYALALAVVIVADQGSRAFVYFQF